MQEEYGKHGITRKITKRSVMTLAYGSAQYGFKENLLEDIVDPYIKKVGREHSIFKYKNQDCGYLAKLIWQVLQSTVVKAVEGMDYLKKLAGLITKEHAVVTWKTPMGFLVQQNYMQYREEIFWTRISNKRVRIYSQEDTGNIDTRKQAQGIAPNYIHSLDASHMQSVILEARETHNIHNFAMIHDSFGTDLANADTMFYLIRKKFIELYDGQDRLQDFVNDIEYLVEDKEQLPNKPTFGTLDIKNIINSKYCFA